jgi:hypothetical protein
MPSQLPSTGKPEIVICTYRIKKGHEDAFLKVLARHWPTLRRQGLVTTEPSVVYRGVDKSKEDIFRGDLHMEGQQRRKSA